MNALVQTICDNDVYLIRLVFALVLGGLIGIERQAHGRPAGLRTNVLVCLGSAALIVTFQRLSDVHSYDAMTAIRMDPARAAAGVITGIGFLGAGTIVKSRDYVRGLTTAASIWVVASVGITVGLGELVIGVALTLLVLLTLVVLHRLHVTTDLYSRVILHGTGGPDLVEAGTAALRGAGATVQHVSVRRSTDGDIAAVYQVRHHDPRASLHFSDALIGIPGVSRVTVR